jgi:hypothetical protein
MRMAKIPNLNLSKLRFLDDYSMSFMNPRSSTTQKKLQNSAKSKNERSRHCTGVTGKRIFTDHWVYVNQRVGLIAGYKSSTFFDVFQRTVLVEFARFLKKFKSPVLVTLKSWFRSWDHKLSIEPKKNEIGQSPEE